ncbi:PREDICTED: poly [ADP-ribose] polymerase 2 isoform X1 [Nanorana parkeri]|uniref:poly [ADP-ribose] polymerase 2 isoform X1 n=1 Tax=Nanorana parkeri TaxID=125878 RepID=UPI000854FA15|nr:PREDICTED: poly [ADP-ribose] polymerase 2 isoform X1 [Nanorana parkeri]
MSGRRGSGRERRPRAVSQKRKAEADSEPEVVIKTELEDVSVASAESGKVIAKSAVKSELVTRWEWLNDGDMWMVYAAELNRQINQALGNGKQSLTLSPAVGVSLQVDFRKMIQKNTKSGYQRQIRLAVKEQDQYFVWQWKSDDDYWVSYDAKTCVLLESALQDDEKHVSLSLGGRPYTVDLGAMVQKNTQTQHEREIQRCLSVAVDQGSDEPKQSVPNGPTSSKRPRRNKSVEIVETEEDSKEQVKTLVLKGKAPIDPECSSKIGKAHVFCEEDDVYDVMLNQTNLQFNNNKYYLIQLLEDDGAKRFSVWMRWGRVGKVGQNSLVSYGGDLQKAKDVFQKKFFDKTKNVWSERGNFEKVPGKYDMLHLDYNTTTEEEKNVVEVDKLSDIPKPECKLDNLVQALIQLICNMQNMEDTVLEMKYDTKKAPLGKLTVDQIHAGYSSLQRIENCIKQQKFGKHLLEACNEFYTRIPHDFGLKTPPLIRTVEELALKVRLLEALGDIQIAVKLASMDLGSHEHPLDRHYRQLQCSLEPLGKTSDEFQLIECYLKTTHASTHNDYTMTLMNVFRLKKEGEESNFRAELPNRMLLWHGSRLSNWVGILSQGLRVAPPEAPVTGYMFGKGIYFADVSSKSANDCFTSRDKNVGILLLCEVALGNCNELIAADYDAQKQLKGKHSTKGVGRSIPDPQKSIKHEGAMVPMGPLIDTGLQNNDGYTLNYNEYIVYDSCQVQMKYLLQVNFNYESLW